MLKEAELRLEISLTKADIPNFKMQPWKMVCEFFRTSSLGRKSE